MNHTPEQQWSALSALYEEADGLPAHELAGWLAELEREHHPLLPQLKRMLEAREHIDTDGFLGTLPKLSADAAGVSDWKEGARVGPYRLVKPLGEGGMAEVWLAERDDGAFKRQVAIKLPYPRPGRETFAVRFDRERDILATLRHPHIAGLYDAGVTKEGQAWLALEYVEGQPISLFSDERKLSVRDRVMLFRQVLLAVQHAHANLVIHRDLKPANILVTSQGEVRLLDFGIAKLLEAQGDAIEETELTRQAGRSMTPRYASPEQLTGLPLTTACDVYSLGVVFYELVSGERPYELKVESPAQLEHAILEVEPRAPSRRALSEALAEARGTTVKGLRKVLAPELDAIALRCLEKKPSARYLSVDAVLADVDRWLGGEAVLARSPGAWYRFGKFAKRHRLAVGVSVSAVVALVAATTIALLFAVQARQESARAVAARDFMLGLFKRADQEKSRGADITARELLETGRRDLQNRLKDQPLLEAELLQGIGTIQVDMGEYVPADGTFADAAKLYARLGLRKEATLAQASQADNAMRMGNLVLAGELLKTARQYEAASGKDDEVSARLDEVEGWIVSLQGNGERGRTLFNRSHDLASKYFPPSHPRVMGPLRGAIYAERLLANFDRALEIQKQAELALPDLDSRERATSDVERAELLQSAGRYAEANDHIRQALPRCSASMGPNHEGCRRLLVTRMLVLLRLGLLEEARSVLPSFETLMSEQSSPALKTDSELVVLRVESMTGRSPRQEVLLKKVAAFGQSGAEVRVNPALKIRALLAVGESHLLLGDVDLASESLDRALNLDWPGRSAPQARLLYAVGRSLKAIATVEGGDPNGAIALFLKSQEDFTSVLGARHPLGLLFKLNMAIALDRIGRNAEASAIVDEAQPVLRAAYGAESPAFARIERLRLRLRERADERAAHKGSTESVSTTKFEFFS